MNKLIFEKTMYKKISSIYDGYILFVVKDDCNHNIVCLGKKENQVNRFDYFDYKDCIKYDNYDQSLIYLSNNHAIYRLLDPATYMKGNALLFEDKDFEEFKNLQGTVLAKFSNLKNKEYDIQKVEMEHNTFSNNYLDKTQKVSSLMNQKFLDQCENIRIYDSCYENKVAITFYSSDFDKSFVCLGDRQGLGNPLYDKHYEFNTRYGRFKSDDNLIFLSNNIDILYFVLDHKSELNSSEKLYKEVNNKAFEEYEIIKNNVLSKLQLKSICNARISIKNDLKLTEREFYMAEARNQLETIGKVDNEKIAVKMLKAGYSECVIKRTMYKCSLIHDLEKVCSIVNKAKRNPEVKKALQKINEGR